MEGKSMRGKLAAALLTFVASISLTLAAPGDHVWSFGIGGTTAADNIELNAIAVDSSGNTLITGSLTTGVSPDHVNLGGSNFTSFGDRDIFVAKYNSSGVHQWSKQFGGTLADIGYGIGTDSSGNVYVAGTINSAVNFGGGAVTYSGNSDIFILKLDSSGNYVWAFGFGGTANEAVGGLAAMADGTFAITGSYGQFGTAVNFGGGALPLIGSADTYVAKFTNAGALLWSKSQGASGTDAGKGIAIDTSGNVFITGYFGGNLNITNGPTRCPHTTTYTASGGFDGFVADYSSASGTLAWLRTFSGTGEDRGFSIAAGPSGEVAVSGFFYQSSTPVNFGGSDHASSGLGADLFVVKYTNSGGFVWDGAFGTNVQSADTPFATGIDAAGNVVITGNMQGPTDFGGGQLCGPSCNTDTYDVMIVKFNSSGVHQWSKRFWNAFYDETAYGIAFDSGNNVIIGGLFLDQENFGGGALTPNGPPGSQGSTGFVAQFLP